MNIAQMVNIQMQRLQRQKPDNNLTGVSKRSFDKGNFKRDDFSKVLGNTFEKKETGKPKASASVASRKELQKPVDEPKAPDTETDKITVEDKETSEKTGSTEQKRSTEQKDSTEQTGSSTEMASPEQSGSLALTGSNEAVRQLYLQIADLLKLMGISVDEKGVLSQHGSSVLETVNQQEPAGSILQEPGAREAVLRLIQILEGLTQGNHEAFNPFMNELKSLVEAQSSDLNSRRAENLLPKLVKVMEKALGKSSAEKNDAVTLTADSKNPLPVIETVIDNSSDEGTAGVSIKGSERFHSDTAQNDNNGFNFDHSEAINTHNERPVSGNGFSAVEEVLTNKQSAQVNKLAQSIFGQIAQKARVIVLPGVTEMQIQLKPGSLGQLNMSISSENGTVTARFTAETHAVKGIIEANLNNLKDTLNQQGIKVDQLVVDIGAHNHQPGFEQRQSMYRGQNGSKNNRISVKAEEVERMFSTEKQSANLKDYYGSTVEFTA